MAYATETPKENFRLSMLIYDTRFRSMTIQIVVLILFGLALSWLVNNTIDNLAAKGKTFNYNFLWVRAGYDIEQTLIPYTNDSSHGRALFVGLANTLLVAFVGCILATIVGVLVGVLRLSKNWLVARIMTVYVEIFRNIPVLLWILFIYVPLTEIGPEPKDFKVTQPMIDALAIEAQGGTLPPDAVTTPAASKVLFDTVAITKRGMFMPKPLLERPLGSFSIGDFTISFSVLAALAVVAASIWVNAQLRRKARVVQETTGVRPTTWWKSLLILFAPLVLLLIAMGFHLEVPAFPVTEAGVSQGFNFQGGFTISASLLALTVALALYTGAFIAEIVRAGIMAISKGQSEASFALGLRPGRTMSLVVLPQALRVIIPPLISQYLNLTKNTSLGIAVSYLDLRGTLGGITLNQTGRELECMLLMMLIYLTISLIISVGMNIYNQSVQLKAR
ncbi:amino acid ABC transporter permease [Neogemmobacter tilapiae]|uniref:Amino acid ABC transporter permease n=1 Tax=Neogemmobacter tilapiae TaxID=875041 RepID=A0A918WJ83_9RHOB|nr:ABC transporter permease subunit [Gemmobacter tilapiae]GHC56796.1 amino acid ABC transporter permease [Gemmobacter tilapiae]